ncbi:hypothetical protein PILCRDRAFT_4118 [Piloderma croceum F 1598]|uniref:Uncharacterized protein n=1 Tax=Piloderma croceum (strain F 1598) TaxID=765440 RepID=A0A0C3G7G4_PILCF|nr:hypothetical protein PILCRDRAFT_4118 [Piloderma croceum F 1598]
MPSLAKGTHEFQFSQQTIGVGTNEPAVLNYLLSQHLLNKLLQLYPQLLPLL